MYLKVSTKLQVPGHASIFALGDIIDWKEQKQAAKCNGHVPVVAENVLSYLDDKPLAKDYKGSPEMIVITNGRVRRLYFYFSTWTYTFKLFRHLALDTCLSCGESCLVLGSLQ